MISIMSVPLMPRATAIWLIDNTTLTFEQIANFCGLHIFEVESLANGDMDAQMSGFDPIASAQLTLDEIRRCEKDQNAALTLKAQPVTAEEKYTGRNKYTPKSKRQDKPDAICWIIKYYPEVLDQDICKLLGTTKVTVHSIRNKTHKNIENIKPKNPVNLGLCNEDDLEFIISKTTRGKNL